MDRIEAVTVQVYLDAISETLEKKHDELMDLEYADENCTFYYEDQVWDIFRSCNELIMHCVNKMRKELLDESNKM